MALIYLMQRKRVVSGASAFAPVPPASGIVTFLHVRASTILVSLARNLGEFNGLSEAGRDGTSVSYVMGRYSAGADAHRNFNITRNFRLYTAFFVFE